MTNTFTKAIVDCQTGIVTNVPMTAEEIEEHQQAFAESQKRKQNAKKQKRLKRLSKYSKSKTYCWRTFNSRRSGSFSNLIFIDRSIKWQVQLLRVYAIQPRETTLPFIPTFLI
jgi:hypothetical protein